MRNKKVLENSSATPAAAMEWSKKQVLEWREVQKKKRDSHAVSARGAVRDDQKWTALDEGDLKLNVDASVVKGSSLFTVGMVQRDHRGHFVEGRNLRVAGTVSAFEAEARGALEALSWAGTMQEKELTIESDSPLVVSAIYKSVVYKLEVGHILDECRASLEATRNISLRFIRRQANKAAHLMARVPCSLYCYNVFVSPPVSRLLLR